MASVISLPCFSTLTDNVLNSDCKAKVLKNITPLENNVILIQFCTKWITLTQIWNFEAKSNEKCNPIFGVEYTVFVRGGKKKSCQAEKHIPEKSK